MHLVWKSYYSSVLVIYFLWAKEIMLVMEVVSMDFQLRIVDIRRVTHNLIMVVMVHKAKHDTVIIVLSIIHTIYLLIIFISVFINTVAVVVACVVGVPGQHDFHV